MLLTLLRGIYLSAASAVNCVRTSKQLPLIHALLWRGEHGRSATGHIICHQWASKKANDRGKSMKYGDSLAESTGCTRPKIHSPARTSETHILVTNETMCMNITWKKCCQKTRPPKAVKHVGDVEKSGRVTAFLCVSLHLVVTENLHNCIPQIGNVHVFRYLNEHLQGLYLNLNRLVSRH